MKRENWSLKRWKAEADKVKSYLVRIRAADDNGMCTCYTWGARVHWKGIQCGHFISRNKLATRFDDDNLRVQCYVCNCIKGGNYPEFARRLVKEKGEEILDELVDRGNKVAKYKKFDYQEMIDQWADECIAHEMRLGI